MTTETMNCATLHLPATAPFDFAASLRFVCGFSPTAGEQDVADGVLRRAVRADGTTVGVRLRAEGDGVRCDLVSDAVLPAAVRTVVVDRVRRQFGLDDDLAPLYAAARSDAPFAAVVEQNYGYHQVRFPSPVELLVWSQLGQRTPMALAKRAKQAIVDACGNRITVDGLALRAFPDLGQLLGFTEAELAELVGNPRRARLLHGALRGFAELDEEFLHHGGFDDVRAALLSLPGIGPWSAAFLMIRGLGRTGRIDPDRQSLAAASRVYGHPVDEAEFIRLAQRYEGHQGYWAHYLRVA